jgi:organic radical activating enzyme
MPRKDRYKPEILQRMSTLQNSWFKFVIDCEEDWEEIKMDFLDPGLIDKKQIILMPKGATRKEMEEHRLLTVEMATTHNVRFTDRLHITLWNKMVGV